MKTVPFLALAAAASVSVSAPEPTPTPPAPLPDLLERLAPGLEAEVLLRAGERLADGTVYAPENDFTAFLPGDARGRGYLLVGHELRFRSQPDGLGGRFTRLHLDEGRVVRGETWTGGMHFNCAGTVTPWNTVLSAEENPHEYLPPAPTSGRPRMTLTDRVDPGDPASQVGWMYEIDPLTADPARRAVRRTAMGRFSHESAAVVDGREVYLTEDAYGGHFYKFVAQRPGDLSRGKLLAYRAATRGWLPVKDLFNVRPEASAAGATPYNRLEDLQLGPDGNLYLAETGSEAAGDPYGRILRFDPRTDAMTVFLEGDGKRLAQPDNLLFDPEGRLLVCEDQFRRNLEAHGSNEVLRVEPAGTEAGATSSITSLLAVLRSGEPSGPSWGPGGVLFLSVMAGERSGLLAIRGLSGPGSVRPPAPPGPAIEEK